MTNDRELLERIDACRADTDDVHDDHLALADELAASPAKRQLYEAVQRVDASIAQAMEEVPLPSGLQERLLAALGEAHQRQTDALAAAETATAVSAEGAPVVHRIDSAPTILVPSTRRRLLWGACLTAAAGLAAVVPAVRFLQADRHELTPARLLDETIAFNSQEEPLDLQTRKQAPYPPSRLLAATVRTMGWRPVNGFLGRPRLNGIAFELQHRGVAATLYAVPTTALPKLRSLPLHTPGIMTAGRSVSAWQERSLVYVLVVHGNDSAYRTFLNLSPIA